MRCTFFLLSIAIILNGCTITSSDSPNDYDPFESYNRSIFNWNISLLDLDNMPQKKPSVIHKTLDNFIHNVYEPVNVLHDLLQGNISYALNDATRFLVNSTLGLAGLLDPASTMTLPKHQQTMGKTLYRWGFKHSPFIMLPLLGPSTLLDTSHVIDVGLTQSMYYAGNPSDYIYPAAKAGQLLTSPPPPKIIIQTLLSQEDPYVFMRQHYLNNRQKDYDNGDNFTHDRENILEYL
ncbi:MAG: VacJ family lipoprotein [Candidatus Comchoanobacterales bacterium]